MQTNMCVINNKTFIERERIEKNNTIYAYLVNENDDSDFAVRKVVLEDNKTYYDPVSSEKEYNDALILLLKNHKEIIDML